MIPSFVRWKMVKCSPRQVWLYGKMFWLVLTNFFFISDERRSADASDFIGREALGHCRTTEIIRQRTFEHCGLALPPERPGQAIFRIGLL